MSISEARNTHVAWRVRILKSATRPAEPLALITTARPSASVQGPPRALVQAHGPRPRTPSSSAVGRAGCVCESCVPERVGHPRRDQHHQPPGGPVLPERLAQHQGPLAVDVVGGQRHKGLVGHCGQSSRVRFAPGLGVGGGAERHLCLSQASPRGLNKSFAGGASGEEPACLFRGRERRRFDPWSGKIPWRRAWPTLGSLPGEPHGQRAWRAAYGP